MTQASGFDTPTDVPGAPTTRSRNGKLKNSRRGDFATRRDLGRAERSLDLSYAYPVQCAAANCTAPASTREPLFQRPADRMELQLYGFQGPSDGTPGDGGVRPHDVTAISASASGRGVALVCQNGSLTSLPTLSPNNVDPFAHLMPLSGSLRNGAIVLLAAVGSHDESATVITVSYCSDNTLRVGISPCIPAATTTAPPPTTHLTAFDWLPESHKRVAALAVGDGGTVLAVAALDGSLFLLPLWELLHPPSPQQPSRHSILSLLGVDGEDAIPSLAASARLKVAARTPVAAHALVEGGGSLVVIPVLAQLKVCPHIAAPVPTPTPIHVPYTPTGAVAGGSGGAPTASPISTTVGAHRPDTVVALHTDPTVATAVVSRLLRTVPPLPASSGGAADDAGDRDRDRDGLRVNLTLTGAPAAATQLDESPTCMVWWRPARSVITEELRAAEQRHAAVRAARRAARIPHVGTAATGGAETEAAITASPASAAPMDAAQSWRHRMRRALTRDCWDRYALLGHAYGRFTMVDLSPAVRAVVWSIVLDGCHPVRSLQLFSDVFTLRQAGLWSFDKAARYGESSSGGREAPGAVASVDGSVEDDGDGDSDAGDGDGVGDGHGEGEGHTARTSGGASVGGRSDAGDDPAAAAGPGGGGRIRNGARFRLPTSVEVPECLVLVGTERHFIRVMLERPAPVPAVPSSRSAVDSVAGARGGSDASESRSVATEDPAASASIAGGGRARGRSFLDLTSTSSASAAAHTASSQADIDAAAAAAAARIPLPRRYTETVLDALAECVVTSLHNHAVFPTIAPSASSAGIDFRARCSAVESLAVGGRANASAVLSAAMDRAEHDPAMAAAVRSSQQVQVIHPSMKPVFTFLDAVAQVRGRGRGGGGCERRRRRLPGLNSPFVAVA